MEWIRDDFPPKAGFGEIVHTDLYLCAILAEGFKYLERICSHCNANFTPVTLTQDIMGRRHAVKSLQRYCSLFYTFRGRNM
jgi:hypothetical protein